MKDILQTSVLIIGSGPTGMVSALFLEKLGVPCIIVERRNGVSNHPKAHELNARSIEILQEVGISYEELSEEASPFEDGARILFCHTINEEYGRIDLLEDAERKEKYRLHFKSPKPYLNLSQTEFEKTLLKHVQSKPTIKIFFKHEWQSLEQNEQEIQSEVLDIENNRVLKIKSKLVLSADGAGSPSRKFLNIAMNGPEKIDDFASAYFEMNLRKHVKTPAKLFWILNPHSPGTFIAHHIEKRWVYMFPIFLDYQKKEDFTKPLFEERIKTSLGNPDLDIEVKSISFWRMSLQFAERFRMDKVLLLGDAAHRFPPTGGLGMNTGIADAHNVAWKVKLFLEGKVELDFLDNYEMERKPVAQQNAEASLYNYHKILDVIEVFGLDKKGMEKIAKFRAVAPGKWLSPKWQDKILNFVANLIAKKMHKYRIKPPYIQKIQAAIADQIPHFDRIGLDIGYSYEKGAIIPDGTDLILPEDSITEYLPSTRPGARFPHLDFQRNEFPQSSHDLLDYLKFTLLIRNGGAEWQNAIENLSPFWKEHLQLSNIDVLDLAIPIHRELVELCGLEDSGALLIRPDGHVAWRLKKLEGNAVEIIQIVFEQLFKLDFSHKPLVISY